MKKLLVLILLLGGVTLVHSQIIKGTVLDKNTRAPVEFAMLYFNGTTLGTYSDENGKFELDVTEHANMPLTVSAINYYSFNVTDFSASKPVIVFLTAKVIELEEVVVTAKARDSKRKANLQLFRDEFFGTTENARKCEIINETDITFNYDPDGDTLKAYAAKPILIRNTALGYTITYFLDQFEYYRKTKSFIFRGNIIFAEDHSGDEEQIQNQERRRKQAYLGSRMQFFRALWANDLKSTAFIVRNLYNETLEYKNIVYDKEGSRKYLQYHENLGICYYSGMPTSTIIFLKPRVYFDKNGYYDPTGISWEGDLVKQRIADWLPYEYTMPD
jgi:hypothetical protein